MNYIWHYQIYILAVSKNKLATKPLDLFIVMIKIERTHTWILWISLKKRTLKKLNLLSQYSLIKIKYNFVLKCGKHNDKNLRINQNFKDNFNETLIKIELLKKTSWAYFNGTLFNIVQKMYLITNM